MSDTPSGASGFDQSAPSRDADADAARRDHLNRVMLRAAGGDQAAFAELYRLTASRVFGTIVRMLHDHGEAEDLLQEVYTTAWRRIDAFDPARGGAMTWLITLARNRTIDRLRQHRDAQLDDEQVAFLKRLPLSVTEGDMLFVHANAFAPAEWEYIQGRIEAVRSLHAIACGPRLSAPAESRTPHGEQAPGLFPGCVSPGKHPLPASGITA